METGLAGSSELERLSRSAGGDGHRIEAVVYAGTPAIVKRQRPARRLLSTHLLRLLAGASGLPLQGAPVAGGSQAQATEVRRLRELRAAGVNVPRVLHEDSDLFVMEMLPGANLACVLGEQPADLDSWQAGLEFILHAHASGQYFSQCFARNLVAGPRTLGAIDFEDDPLQLMPLEAAQARDWLMYLHSTVWMLQPGHDQLLSRWRRIVEAESAGVTQVLLRAARRLAWLRHLPRERRPWGRDVVSLQGAASFLHAWRRSRT